MRRPDNNEHYYAKQAVENRKSKQELLVRICLCVCALRLDDDSDVHIHPIYTSTCWSTQLDVPCMQHTKGRIWKRKQTQNKTAECNVGPVLTRTKADGSSWTRTWQTSFPILILLAGEPREASDSGEQLSCTIADESLSWRGHQPYRAAPAPGTTSCCALPAGLTQGGSAPLWRR